MKMYIVRAEMSYDAPIDFGYYTTRSGACDRCDRLRSMPDFALKDELVVVEQDMDTDLDYVWMTDNV